MAPWPAAHARVLADGEGRALEPAAERSTVGGDAGVLDQVDRATAPRRTRTVRWWCASDADAAAWIAWAYSSAHTWFTGLPGAPATHRWRLVDGLAGAALAPADAGGGRRGWTGEATLESPDLEP